MKRITTILLTTLFLFLQSAFAQTPQQVNYQAYITNVVGDALTNTVVGLRFTFQENGITEYQEEHFKSTDAVGRINLQIGSGDALQGNFQDLDWANASYNLVVELDYGSGYVQFGNNSLHSVFYALHSEAATFADSIRGVDLTNFNDNQNLTNATLNGTVLIIEIENGNAVSVDLATLNGSGFSGDFNDLINVPQDILNGDDVEDADANPTNELQDLTGFLSNDTLTIDIENGNAAKVNLSGLIDDADANPTNELQTLSLAGTQITLSDGNTIDLTSILPPGGSDDQMISISNDTIFLEDGGFVVLPAGSAFSGDFNDLTNVPVDILDGDDVDDADANPTNELQTLSLAGTQITLSDGNTIDLASILPPGGSDDQMISISNDTIYLEDGGFVVLPAGSAFSGDFNDLTNVPANLDLDASDDFSGDFNDLVNIPMDQVDDADADPTNELQDLTGFLLSDTLTIDIENGNAVKVNLSGLIDDADANPTNELQTLSLAGTQITLSDGNTIDLASILPPGGSDDQMISISNDTIYLEDGGFVVLPAGSAFSGDFNDLTNVPVNLDLDASDDFSGDFNDLVNVPMDQVDDADANPTNELQTLSLAGTQITLSDGNTVDLASILPPGGSDDQMISISNDTIYLEDGGFVVLPAGSAFSGDFNDLTNVPVDLDLDATDDFSGDFNDLVNVPMDQVDDADANPTNELQTLSLAGTQITLSDGNTVDLASILPPGGSDDQMISISNDTIHLEDGGFVVLPAGSAFSGDFNELTNIPSDLADGDNDSQQLAVASGQLSISNGNTVTLPDADSTNELQDLTGFISNDTLTIEIENGNSAQVNLSGLIDDADANPTNELQTLSLAGTQITLSDGNTIDLASILPPGGSDDQMISISNDTIYLEAGGFVVLPSNTSVLEDIDGDTRIQVDRIPDWDRLEFVTKDTVRWSISGKGNLTSSNPSGLFIGGRAGESSFFDYDLFTGAEYNTFIGDNSGRNNIIGIDNTFLGYNAGTKSTASANTLIGAFTGSEITTGGGNTFVGSNTGVDLEDGTNNVFIGSAVGSKNISGVGNTMLGNGAGARSTGSENVFVGYNAGSGSFPNSNVANQNTFVGYGSGFANTTGQHNVYLGYNTGARNQDGTNNTLLGYKAGDRNESGSNTMIGAFSGTLSAGQNNIFLGDSTGYQNDGSDNLFIGNAAGKQNEASRNMFIGNATGAAHQTGADNIFIGDKAVKDGDNNTSSIIIGGLAGSRIENSFNNVIMGNRAAEKMTEGDGNVMLGTLAGFGISEGDDNIFIGRSAGGSAGLAQLNVASNNIFIGKFSGRSNETGTSNLFIGNETGSSNRDGMNNIFLGEQAGVNNTGSDNIFIGKFAGQSNTSATRNIYIGTEAGQDNSSTFQGDDNVFLGYNAGKTNTDARNIMIGSYAGANSQDARNNVFIGHEAGKSNTENVNCFIGMEAGRDNATGNSNVFIGYQTGRDNPDATSNVFVGNYAGRENTGDFNVSIGEGAGLSNRGDQAVSMGFAAGLNNEQDGAVLIGYRAGENNSGSPFSSTDVPNTLIGYNSGNNNQSGYGNTFLGANAGYGNIDGSANTFIGANAGLDSENTFSNTFIGSRAGQSNESGSNNICIGASAGNAKLGDRNVIIGHSLASSSSFDDLNRRVLIGWYGASQAFFDGDMANYTTTLQSKRLTLNNPSTGNVVLEFKESNDFKASLGWDPNAERMFFYQGNNAMYIKNGRVGIAGREATSNSLEVNGNASKSTSGSWSANSDSRLKKDISYLEAETMLQKVLQMKGANYHWNDTITGIVRPEGQQFGFIAQDLQQVWPKKVTEDALGYLQTAYGDYDPMFVEAIKALYARIQTLEQENETLKASNEQMQNKEQDVMQMLLQLQSEVEQLKKSEVVGRR